MGSLFSYLVELVFLIVIAKMLGRALQGFLAPPRPRPEEHPAQGGPRNSATVRIGKTERDPVCGMFVSTELSRRLVRGSETLHFCSRECLERYK